MATKEAFAACDREGDHNSVPDLQLLIFGADLDDLSHALMTDDVTRLHLGNHTVENVEVRAADRASSHSDDGIPRCFDLWIGHCFAADVALPMPAKRLHDALRFLLVSSVSAQSGSYCLRVCSARMLAGVILAMAD